jgi:hypothetical protein
VAFVSSQSFAPSTGLATADALCAGEASNAGLEGEFVALLPSGGGAPKARLVQDGRPIVRPDGVVVAVNEVAFGNLDWLAPISYEVYDTQEGNTYVWTAAATPGTVTGGNCGNFASTSGSALVHVAGLPWTQSATVTVTCSTTYPQLYCVSR